MTIYVHIDRLVLDGLAVPSAQRGIVGSALEAELGRLLTTRGVGPRLGGGAVLGQLRAADLRLGGGAAGLGTRIAGAVHQGMHQ
jgi:hypothetical protein